MRRPRAQATRATYPKRPFYKGIKAPRPPYIVAFALFFVVITAFVLPTNEPNPSAPQERQLLKSANIDLNITPAVPTEATSAESGIVSKPEPLTMTIKNGDNMSLVFERAGLGPAIVHQLAYESEHGKNFSKIVPGNRFHFYFNQDRSLSKVVYQISRLESFEAVYKNAQFATRQIVRQPEIFTTAKSGQIQSSFYLDGLEAGLNDNLIMELANIFGWDIDFALEIRKGDQFSVIFEQQYLDGDYLGSGEILAAEFVNRGKSIRAVRYQNKAGQVSFYTPEGLSMRKAFLRTPLDVFRVSSHFNLNRKHPVLNTIRAHKGTDYAAPRGTPVKAAGDGKVVFAGENGGYGNMVKITHGQTYETRYAHLNAFGKGIRSGKWVKQGQIIGYVGTTGLSTGPHLHYEFYVNGAVRNPVTVKLPNGKPIAPDELANFKMLSQPILAMLETSTANYADSRITADSDDS